MHRRLILMRHAKSSWSSPNLPDHERPLNGRGRRDAPRVGQRLAELGWTPDAIWSSDATRTRETAALLIPALDVDPPVTFDPDLYLAGLEAIEGAAADWDPAWTTVLTLGHNPGWESAASTLARRDLSMTTANAVLLQSTTAAPWPDALRGRWSLVDVLRPREL